jgi:hypothetical protein
MRLLAGACAVLVSSTVLPLHAQDSVIVIDPDAPFADSTPGGGLPRAVIDEVLQAWNDSTAVRLVGQAEIPAGNTVTGRLAVFRGILRVAGTIDGPVTVINGNLVLLPGGRISGDVLVVGGRLVIQEGATHDGAAREYWDVAPVYRDRDGRLAVREPHNLADLGTAEATFNLGEVRTTLHASTGGTYNRIEGFPLALGPEFVWRPGAQDRLRLDLTGIVRTTTDNAGIRSDFGFRTRLDWRNLGEIGFGAGLEAYSVVTPFEEQTLSLAESGWSSILLQRDYHDYYDNQGFGGYLFVEPARQFKAEVALRRDHERSVRANDPWSVFRNSSSWRSNPLIDDGHFVTGRLDVTLDTRDSRSLPSRGWYVRAHLETGGSEDVAPTDLPAGVRGGIPTDGSYEYSLVSLDVRRNIRLSPESRLGLRVFGSGWIGGDPLPVQRRQSVGGFDLLPGHDFRAVRCSPDGDSDPSNASLCDRMAAAQVEFRTRLSLGWRYRLREGERPDLDRIIGIESADLVLFANTGNAWLAGDGPGRVPSNKLPSLDLWKADLGIGVDVGFIAAYLAKSVTNGEPIKFSVRLQRRF